MQTDSIADPDMGIELPVRYVFLIAFLIELLLLGLGASFLAHGATARVQEENVMTIAMDEAPPPPPPQKPEPVRHIKEVVRQTPVKQVVPQPPSPEVQLPSQSPEIPPAPSPAPSPIAETPAREISPPQTHSHAEKEIEFAARLKAAIQAAVVYPAAARNMGFSGRVRIEFHFLDGRIHRTRIVHGSGIGMIDQAALASVSNAVVPPIPDSLKGKEQTYQVTVEFELKRR